MGLFDRFKKKEEKPVEERKIPLTLNYSDGTVAEITFNGMCDVEGKRLHSAQALYHKPDGTFEGKRLLLEPITQKGADGNIVDATETYYRWMSEKDGTVEGQARYNASKGFFKRQDVERIGNEYIGNLALNENGQYYRNYDWNFKNNYDRICKENKALEDQSRKQEQEFRDKLQQERYENMKVNIKTSHAEDLSKIKNPYESR